MIQELNGSNIKIEMKKAKLRTIPKKEMNKIKSYSPDLIERSLLLSRRIIKQIYDYDKEGGTGMNVGMNDIKVGNTFVCRGKIYRCVEDNMNAATFDCVDTCALHGKVLCEFCACFPDDRKDGKSVHFEEVKP